MPKVIFWPFVSEDTGLDPFIELTWTPSVSAGVVQYNVYRSLESGEAYTLIGSVPSSQSSFIDPQVSRGMTYYYVVTSYDGSLESTYSNQAAGTPT